MDTRRTRAPHNNTHKLHRIDLRFWMGQGKSKDKEEEEPKGFDKKLIFIDEYGNFVYGSLLFIHPFSLTGFLR